MIYIGGRRSTKTATPAISRKDDLSLLVGEGTSFLRISATKDDGNANINSLANQWIMFVATISKRCPSVAHYFRHLLALLAAKQPSAQRELPWKLFIAVLADVHLVVRITVIVPRTLH